MGLLPVVLSKEVCLGGCLGNERQTLYQELPESELRRAQDHALDALLPLVPEKSPTTMEVEGQSTFVQVMQLGNRTRVLELLRLVSRARPT